MKDKRVPTILKRLASDFYLNTKGMNSIKNTAGYIQYLVQSHYNYKFVLDESDEWLINTVCYDLKTNKEVFRIVN